MQLETLSVKQISDICKVSLSTSKRIYKDLKLEYNTKYVVREHLIRYLGLN